MIRMSSQLNAYKKNQINTTSSEHLVLMLYEGARKFIRSSIISLENGDIEAANHNLLRAQNIISELMSGINYNAGEIAKNLFDLYEYMHFQLIQANLKKDRQQAEEVLDMVEDLRTVWVQIMQGRSSQEAMSDFNKKMHIG
jgi:flagellar protein FliS